MNDSLVTSSGLLRVAGAPISAWLRAANPELFARVRELERRGASYEALGRQLADELGRELLAEPDLPRAERSLALQARRDLHNGRPLERATGDRLVVLATALGLDAARWRERLGAAVEASRELAALAPRIEGMVDAEEARLAELAWSIVRDLPIARVLVSHRDPSFSSALAQRVARGLSWRSKSARQSGAYVWKVLVRATTKSNPRDFHGHVALLPVEGDAAPGEPLRLRPEFAAQWLENMHRQRRELGQGPRSHPPDARLSLTPLHWWTETHLRAWVVDRVDATEVREVELRRISLLDAIHAVLADGSLPYASALVAAGTNLPEADRELLPGIVEHLVGLGVLEVSSSPRERFVEPLASAGSHGCIVVEELVLGPTPEAAPLDARRKETGFLDVYRRAGASLPMTLGLRLQRQFGEVQRLLTLIDADRSPMTPRADDGPPVPLLAAIEAQVLAPARPSTGGPAPLARHWPLPREATSGYARLLAFVASKADRSAVVDIDAQRLDELGAPPAAFDWPVDCILRLPAGSAPYDAVLDEAFPAGSLDARFVAALRRIEGELEHVDRYSAFLRELEASTDATILELLIPPCSIGAANAIRRPLLARAWTGDADVEPYIEGARAAGLRHVPLGSLTLRRERGKTVVEAGGRRMWPIYHATRLPLPPWNVLADVLLTASPLRPPWAPRRLHFSLDAFPERAFMPRITVGGGMVIACAQWRLPPGLPWERGASLRTKIHASERLKARLGLPRWVFASSGPKRKPVACDLESVLGLRALEDAARDGAEVLLAEMLPSPEALRLVDDSCAEAGPSVSSVMLRLPLDEPTTALARRIAARLREPGATET